MSDKEKVKLDFGKPHITYKNSKGERIVGVTTALNLLAKPALIPWAYGRGKDGLSLYESRDRAADVGTIVHAGIMAYYGGYEIDNSNISPDVWSAVEQSMKSFYEWAKPRNVKPILIETPLISNIYQYGGTLDIYGEMDNELTLLDFKSGSGLYDEHFIQLAAYLQLLREAGHNPVKIVILNIPKSKDDSFTLKSISADEYTLELRFKKFLKLVEIWHLDNELKKYQKGSLN